MGSFRLPFLFDNFMNGTQRTSYSGRFFGHCLAYKTTNYFMDFRKLVKESLSMLDKSDQGVIFQDMHSQVVHVADAAFYGKEVYPKDLLELLQSNFGMSGFPLEDSQFRKDLRELLDKYETALAQKPRRKRVVLDEDFGKIM